MTHFPDVTDGAGTPVARFDCPASVTRDGTVQYLIPMYSIHLEYSLSIAAFSLISLPSLCLPCLRKTSSIAQEMFLGHRRRSSRREGPEFLPLHLRLSLLLLLLLLLLLARQVTTAVLLQVILAVLLQAVILVAQRQYLASHNHLAEHLQQPNRPLVLQRRRFMAQEHILLPPAVLRMWEGLPTTAFRLQVL